jgi:hypothetical protein
MHSESALEDEAAGVLEVELSEVELSEVEVELSELEVELSEVDGESARVGESPPPHPAIPIEQTNTTAASTRVMVPPYRLTAISGGLPTQWSSAGQLRRSVLNAVVRRVRVWLEALGPRPLVVGFYEAQPGVCELSSSRLCRGGPSK